MRVKKKSEEIESGLHESKADYLESQAIIDTVIKPITLSIDGFTGIN